MAKKFNDTGTCLPNKHYMVDTSAKVKKTIEMVDDGLYFTINRPRQFGKTTTLFLLYKKLLDLPGYLVFDISFEGIGDAIFEDETVFCPGLFSLLSENFQDKSHEVVEKIKGYIDRIDSLKTLSIAITDLCKSTDKKFVILIDEVDKSSNNQLFVSFLGMLRNKYLDAGKDKDYTFHSVVLAGLHDVKTLKMKISPESTGKLNSPWNIATDFTVDLSFNPAEISTMLVDYAKEKGIDMDISAISERIYYYTSGYPYLVSKMCKIVDEIILPANSKNWTLDDIELSFKKITAENYTTTLFDDQTKNLENNPNLFQLVSDVVIKGERFTFNINEPTIYLGLIYGIFTDKNISCSIHNRIFEQRIYNYMLAKYLIVNTGGKEIISEYYIDNGLNLKFILQRYQQFMKENYAKKDKAFLEREGRLIFLSFLKPIINGKGFDFKEPVVGDERRMDIVITFNNQRHVVELKRWSGYDYHQNGLQQLSDYLDIYSLKQGFLLIYDFRKGKKYVEETIQFNDKVIFAVWV